eukprot:4270240-Amphidinium_carterae.1
MSLGEMFCSVYPSSCRKEDSKVPSVHVMAQSPCLSADGNNSQRQQQRDSIQAAPPRGDNNLITAVWGNSLKYFFGGELPKVRLYASIA